MCLLVSDTLTRIQRSRFSAVVRVHQIHGARYRRATQQSTVPAALVSCLLFLISIHPGTSSTVSTYLSLSSSLDALLESREVVSDTLAPLPLDLVRDKEQAVVVAVQAQFQAWPSRLRYPDVSVCFFSPLLRMSLAVGNTSWSVIATPTRHAAPFKPPTGRAATDPLTSRFSPVMGRRTSCWQSRPLGSRSHCGRFIRSVLGSVISCCGTRVCSMTMSDKCATRVLDGRQIRTLFGQSACANTQVSQCCWSVSCCVQACKDIRRNTKNMRVNCAHVGKPSTNRTHTGREERVGKRHTHTRRKKRDRSREGQKRTHQFTFAERLRL